MKREITSNQLYGALNKRFDKRVKVLVGFGFKQHRTESGLVFQRHGLGLVHRICAGTMLHACNRTWRDELARILRRSY